MAGGDPGHFSLRKTHAAEWFPENVRFARFELRSSYYARHFNELRHRGLDSLALLKSRLIISVFLLPAGLLESDSGS